MTSDDRAEGEKRNRVFVDELDHDQARLLFGETTFSIPRALLPDDAREGDWLLLGLSKTDIPADLHPDDLAARRERLGRGDPGGPIKL